MLQGREEGRTSRQTKARSEDSGIERRITLNGWFRNCPVPQQIVGKPQPTLKRRLPGLNVRVMLWNLRFGGIYRIGSTVQHKSPGYLNTGL
jgi:hypothetical protein